MQLAPYACDPAQSKGRVYDEPVCPTRNHFQRDRDRIIHCDAFRRLKYKTQVFVYHQGDHYRTRLTHSLEVAQIARSIARCLHLHEDLAEAISLAHDLGHPPFAHAGEKALSECMKDYGGFDHNAQTIRIVTSLEMRYAAFDGLNLSWETLEGIAKHNGPLLKASKEGGNIPLSVLEFQKEKDLELESYASAEAQIAAIADDIAYNNHDIEDGLVSEMFHMDDLVDLPVIGDVVREVRRKYSHITYSRQIHELVRRLINMMVTDVLEETRHRINELNPSSVEGIRYAGKQIADFSTEMKDVVNNLRDFLFHHMYRHYEVNRTMSKAQRIVKDLFEIFFKEPNTLPDEWQDIYKTKCSIENKNESKKLFRLSNKGGNNKHEVLENICKARVVLDYVAGMTDRYAIEEHRKMFDPYTK